MASPCNDLVQSNNQMSHSKTMFPQLPVANMSRNLDNHEPCYSTVSGDTSFPKPSIAVRVHALPSAATVCRSRTFGKIARPPNAFIMFRSNFVKKYPKIKTVEKQQKNISRIVGEAWRMLGAHKKMEWYDRAAEAARQHKLDHPDYKFSPAPRGSCRLKDNSQTMVTENIAERTKQLRETFTEFKGVAPPSVRRKTLKKVKSADVCIAPHCPSFTPANLPMQIFKFPPAQSVEELFNEDLNPQGSSSLNRNVRMAHLPFDSSDLQMGESQSTIFGHSTEIGGGFALANNSYFSSPTRSSPLNFSPQPQLVDPFLLSFNFCDLDLQGITYNCDNSLYLNGSLPFQQPYNPHSNTWTEENYRARWFAFCGQPGPNVGANGFISGSF